MERAAVVGRQRTGVVGKVRLTRALRRLATGVALTGAVACATTGSTVGSGVGDTFLDRAPFYAGATASAVRAETRAIGHIPVAYQRGASQAALFDPALGPSMHLLLERMTAALDSLGVSTRLVEGERVSAVAHQATSYPPDVQFGCEPDPTGFDDECLGDGEEVLGRGDQRLRLAVGRPSPEWTGWAADVMAASGVDRMLVLMIEVGQYPVRQRGLLGRKEVELGTDHVQEIPWLTSLETPVSVLQLTGVLVGPDGTAVRIGAEGLIARRTRMGLSAIGAQELITDDEIEAVLSLRREELSGAPLVWEVALQNLVRQLTGGA